MTKKVYQDIQMYEMKDNAPTANEIRRRALTTIAGRIGVMVLIAFIIVVVVLSYFKDIGCGCPPSTSSVNNNSLNIIKCVNYSDVNGTCMRTYEHTVIPLKKYFVTTNGTP